MAECKDERCPKHGHLKVRGNIFEGAVVSVKPKNTAIVKTEYLHYVPKYERYERRSTRINAYLPSCVTVKVGDQIKVGECRKLSKTKSFVVMCD